MRFAVWILGIIIVIEGLIILIKPLLYKNVAAFFSKSKLMVISALIKTAFGVFLLVAATSCQNKLIIIILGLISAGSGVTMLAAKMEKLNKFYLWWSTRPNLVIRIMGLPAIAVGGLMIYAAGTPE